MLEPHCQMSTKFFAWSKDEQLDQLKQYLIENSPSTSSLLGWLIGTGVYNCEPAAESVIWSSHDDPFHTMDIVVWFLQTKDRMRVYVSSEAILDQSPMCAGTEELAHGTAYPPQLPSYFVCGQKQLLYERSLEVFETALNDFIHSNYNQLQTEKGKNSCMSRHNKHIDKKL